MTKLYEMTADYRAVARMAEDPEMADAVADTLEGIKGSIEDKGEALMKVVKGMEGDTAALAAEIKRLQARKKTIEGNQAWLKNYLLTNMAATDITLIECPLFRIRRSPGREIVQIDDQAAIPPRFMTKPKKPDPQPIKAEILKALKAGKTVKGCSLARAKESLRIT
jgi:hypothetical protein